MTNYFLLKKQLKIKNSIKKINNNSFLIILTKKVHFEKPHSIFLLKNKLVKRLLKSSSSDFKNATCGSFFMVPVRDENHFYTLVRRHQNSLYGVISSGIFYSNKRTANLLDSSRKIAKLPTFVFIMKIGLNRLCLICAYLKLYLFKIVMSSCSIKR